MTTDQRQVSHRDHQFIPYITQAQLQARIAELGKIIGRDYEGKKPLLLAVLNGAFMFAADLMRAITTPSEITFVKYASYQGTASTGNMKQLLGLNESLEGRHVLVVEDIVDTGHTMHKLLATVREQNPASVEVVSCLHKPEALQTELTIKYLCFEIPNRFVIGYGLDFDGFGRHLPHIYQLTEA